MDGLCCLRCPCLRRASQQVAALETVGAPARVAVPARVEVPERSRPVLCCYFEGEGPE